MNFVTNPIQATIMIIAIVICASLITRLVTFLLNKMERFKKDMTSIYLIRDMCPNYSFPKIGELFGGRDHTTILHSYEKICDELKMSQDLGNTIKNIKDTLES